MASIEERIAAQELRLKQLKALKQKQTARERSEAMKKQRQDDTRRKILAGALILELCEKNATTKDNFWHRLDAYLTRADDRALFDLSQNAETAAKADSFMDGFFNTNE